MVTSRKLIDRLGIEVEGADYLFLEDLRAEIGKFEAGRTLACLLPASPFAVAARAAAESRRSGGRAFHFGIGEHPEGRSPDHRNLLSNARAGLAIIQPTRADAMLGFLPPFHSFGLLGNIIVPILAGFRVVHHPDPTDAVGLVRATAGYRPTLLVSTPTFLSYMCAVATPDDLTHAPHYCYRRGEMSRDAFRQAKQMAPQATILEGYGITECSPVVSGNRLDRIKPGTVGLPLDGVEVCLVDPESKQPLPAGSTGLLLVRGPSIFHGYLDYDGPDPFLEVAGKRWYVTGDLVQLDEEGFIYFRGRLKRFLKAGGEMISLPALEEPLSELYPPTEQGPQVAVEGVETPDGRWIVLFTRPRHSAAAGQRDPCPGRFRGVMRLDDVVRLDAIPVLGTGKTDYKVLRKLVLDKTHAGTKTS